MKKYKKCNTGGKIGVQDIAGLATGFINPISAIPSAINMISKLAYNPSSYTPAKMNESPTGYAYGGEVNSQLNVFPNIDKQIGDHAIEVDGNSGIDTNYRNIDGQNIALTKGEIVREDPDGSAYVWSNNPKMKHSSGETFAKAMKPFENKIAKIKKRIEKDPTDYIAVNTLGHLEQIIEQNKNKEEMLRKQKGSPNAQAYNKGGYIKANDGYDTHTPIIPDVAIDALIEGRLSRFNQNPAREALMELPSSLRKRTQLTPSGVTTPSVVSPKIASPSQRVSNSPFSGTPQNFLKDNPSPLTSVTGVGLPNLNDTLSTFEDKAFLGVKGLETVGRIANALQKPTQYDTRRYNVDKIKYNPNRVLDRNEANYQGSQFDINTGNANTDRILRNNLYAQKLQADRDVYREYDQMQRQSDLQVDQYNAQAMANVDNINEQIRGRQQQARDAALTSIGNMSSIFQQAGGAKAHNKITLATLNSLSNRYGIDVPNLMLMLEGQGNVNKGIVNYKGN